MVMPRMPKSGCGRSSIKSSLPTPHELHIGRSSTLCAGCLVTFIGPCPQCPDALYPRSVSRGLVYTNVAKRIGCARRSRGWRATVGWRISQVRWPSVENGYRVLVLRRFTPPILRRAHPDLPSATIGRTASWVMPSAHRPAELSVGHDVDENDGLGHGIGLEFRRVI